MKIVGVMRKPAGLGADLKAGTEITDDQESLLSLSSRGFYLASVSGGQPELHAANGELVVTLYEWRPVRVAVRQNRRRGTGIGRRQTQPVPVRIGPTR